MIADKASILYVDDEANNLISFKAAFRRFYNIHTAESATEGLEMLKVNDIHIIITDQRMPSITGVQFLESVSEAYPDRIKMLLTGYADMEAIINAVNKGHIYRYINKPWDESELRIAIDNAFEIYKTKTLLEEKTFQLETAYQELNRFAYSASHDIRGPLTTIMGVINLAKTDNHFDENEYLQMIEATTKKLDDFTLNIINYYKNSRQEKQHSPIDFKVLITQLLEQIKLNKDCDNIDFKVNVIQQDPFYSDELRLNLILSNIITNAIIYKKKNIETIIEIDVSIENHIANLQIKDNGIGIPAEHIENIFNMFYRASQESKGSGLGLYIVKNAVAQLKGFISVSSTINAGSCFTLSIPENLPKTD